MGQPKLLLPWKDGRLIDHVLREWTCSGVDEVIVIVRRDDALLAEACRTWPVVVVQPREPPEDMKQSIIYGLRWIEENRIIGNDTTCFVAPADLPTFRHQIVNRMIACCDATDAITVPYFGGKQGHPIAFPWSIAAEVHKLKSAEGIDQLIKRHPIVRVELPPEQRPVDVDTPAEFRALQDEQRSK